ncbi:hypothetical protein BSLG_003324 [Batrachochytrium salamandrivorans]|nr:hypothetical protein BSLG_003324 [Batrachochytrium salamandrivorans]
MLVFFSYYRSRLIVKNLPHHITPERLREHFSKKGQITDVKLATTKDGVFRGFGFIGFKTPEQATSAIAYFHRTYIDTSRIEVEVAKAIGDASLDRGWSKHTPGTSANSRMVNKNNERELRRSGGAISGATDIDASEPSQSVPLNNKQRKFLADLQESPDDPKLKTAHQNDSEFVKVSVQVPVNEEDMLYDELPTTASAVAEDIDPIASIDNSSNELVANKVTPEQDSRFSSAAFDSKLSDLEYMRSKMKKPEDLEVVKIHPSRLAVLEGTGAVHADGVHNTHIPTLVRDQEPSKIKSAPVTEDTSDDDDEAADSARLASLKSAVDEVPAAELIADTGRIMVRNLTYLCTPEEIEDLFKPFGPIAEVHIPIDRDTKKSKGYAFVLYLLPENAVNAYNRELQRKGNSSSDFNWNSLFMNADTVAEAMAQKLNVRKSDILDKNVDNMAVRLALAETDIISETKAYFESENVSIEALATPKTRSNNVILVKNIPHSTQETDLTETFGKFGTLGRIILPPTKTIALVEFLEHNEAKAAFRKLAYSKFKNAPLYLQWASQDIFKTAYDAEKKKAKQEARLQSNEASKNLVFNATGTGSSLDLNQQAKTVEEGRRSHEGHRIADLKEDDVSTPVASIYVKNLNFKPLKRSSQCLWWLDWSAICQYQDERGSQDGWETITRVWISWFATTEDATRCIKAMQNFKLDNHVLQLKYSKPADKPTLATSRKRISGVDDDDDDDAKIKGTKLVVRNVPFEASKKDIKELFSSFAHVKSVRIPTKFDGQHRGFAFVDFLTKQEAKTAFETLGATHLYGRHLVLEWAQDDESVEAVRSKTAKLCSGRCQKRKVEMEDDDDMDQ